MCLRVYVCVDSNEAKYFSVVVVVLGMLQNGLEGKRGCSCLGGVQLTFATSKSSVFVQSCDRH